MFRYFKFIVLLALATPMFQAHAQSSSDYTRGVELSGQNAVIWFRSNVNTQWVDVHYVLAGGAQQNVRMVYNGGSGRHEHAASPAAQGQTVAYFFTYNNGTSAYDTPWFNQTLGSGGGGGGGSGGDAYTRGVEVSGNTALIWFRSNVNTQWVDVHYVLAGGAQQNLRMSYNAAANRHQQVVAPVSNGQTLAYFFTYNNGVPAHDTPWFSTVIGSGTGGPTAAPTFSPAPGTYSQAQQVSLSSATSGAVIRYTTDGSTPNAGSPVYSAPLSIAASTTIRAIAIHGQSGSSSVSQGSYVIQSGSVWNERTTFRIVNQTRGQWANNQVYWSIIGKSWQTGQFVWVNAQGQQIPMSVSDNGALVKNGQGYTNYFHRLSDLPQVTIDPINSARIMFSVGSPMYIKVVIDGNGQVGYAGANIVNPTDPNLDVYFDFGEMAILPRSQNDPGIFVNTTRVDHFGFPLQLRVQGLDGYDQTVGEKVAELTRAQVFDRFQQRVPAEFKPLGQAPYAPYRIIAPAHATFNHGGPQQFYLQPYIDAIWARYRNDELVFALDHLGTFRGRVFGDTFRFTGGHQNGTFFINGKPDTQMVMLGAGLLADAANAAPQHVDTQLQIQAQFAAAINRRVLETPAQWYSASHHYPAGQRSNFYAWFWHGSDIAHHNLAYGFSYDDVGGHSPSLHTQKPTMVTYTIGW